MTRRETAYRKMPGIDGRRRNSRDLPRMKPTLPVQMIPCNGPPGPPGRSTRALDLGVVHQRRGVVRLDPGVDHQRARAAPVLLIGEGADPVDVGRRVRAGERHPEEIAAADRAANSAVIATITISGNARIGSSGAIARQKRRDSRSSSSWR